MSNPDADVDDFLTQVSGPSKSARGRLVFGLDATMSRQETWDSAVQLQAEMFREVAAIGKLDVQLVYFRGIHGFDGECRASAWVSDALELAKLMNRITCRAGHTQIERVLRHALQESTTRHLVSALCYVGDMCEDNQDGLMQAAQALGQQNVPAFMFQEAHDQNAKKVFQDIAKLTKGAYAAFGTGSAHQLGELLRAVALFATGGMEALADSSNPETVKLLTALRG
jgi:hypothetical protein